MKITLNRQRLDGGGKGEKGVLVDGLPLSPKDSQKIVNHSPDGFEWGYGGSGPAQLSLAIVLVAAKKLLDPLDPEHLWIVEPIYRGSEYSYRYAPTGSTVSFFLFDRKPRTAEQIVAVQFYQDFKFEHVARWRFDEGEVEIDVEAWLTRKLLDRAAAEAEEAAKLARGEA